MALEYRWRQDGEPQGFGDESPLAKAVAVLIDTYENVYTDVVEVVVLDDVGDRWIVSVRGADGNVTLTVSRREARQIARGVVSDDVADAAKRALQG